MNTFRSLAEILLTSSAVEPTRRRLTKKLQGFSQLQPGWNFGGGTHISDTAVRIAHEYVLRGTAFGLEGDVFPNPDGGCAVAFYQGQDSVEINVHPDGALSLSVERGVGVPYEQLVEPSTSVHPSEVFTQLQRLALQGNRWKLPVSSISFSTTEPVSGFVILSTKTPATLPIQTPLLMDAGGSQSLNTLVLATI